MHCKAIIRNFLNAKTAGLAPALAAQWPLAAGAADLVRLGNLKFAHYGAVAYMKEIAPRFTLKFEERVFAKGLDIVPAATPDILAGARIGMGTAFIVVIVAEMIAVNNGLGFRILEAREYFWSDKIIAGMFSIGLLGLAIDTAMNALNNHLLKWHRCLDNN